MQTIEWASFRHLTLKRSNKMFTTEHITVLEILYHKRNPHITKTESETNSNKKKTHISFRSRIKLIHDSYIST